MLVKTYLAPSPIHGTGVFTAEDIPRDALIWRVDWSVDRKISQAEFEQLSGAHRELWNRYAYLSRQHGVWILCGDNGRFFNHSDAPNTYERYREVPFGIDLAARDIARGEELTTDYFGFDQDARRKLTDAVPRSA